MSPLTVSVPILGAFAVRTIEISSWDVIYLALIGFCCHIFGFVLNDIIDLPIDINAPYRKKSALVSGKVKRQEAWIIVFIQIPIIYYLYIISLGGLIIGVILLTLSILSSIIYNLYSKKGFIPKFLAETSLALSISLLCLAASVVFTETIDKGPLIISVVLFFVLLSVNSVSSGLKDLKSDFESGGNSFVISMGARVFDKKVVYIPQKLVFYANIIQLIIVFSLIHGLNYYNHCLYIKIMALVFCSYAFMHLNSMLRKKTFVGLVKSKVLLNGYYNYAALLLIFYDLLPILLRLLFIFFLLLPILFFFQRKRKRNRHYLF